MNVKRFLSKVDMFGVAISQSFDTDLPTYKSAIGGISTIIIYSLSLTYAIYMFVLRFDGQLQPSASTTNYITDFSQLDQTNSLIQISYWRYNNALIDPFQSKGNILTPILYITTQNNENVSQQVLLDKSNNAYNEYNSTLLDSDLKIEFTYNNSTFRQNIKYDYFILIVRCEASLMSNGSYCANQSQMDAFFAQKGNTVLLDYRFQTLDFFTRKRSIIKQRLYIQIEDAICYLQTSYLKSTLYTLQDNLLFGSPYTIELIDTQRIQSQSNSIQFCKQQFNNYTTYISGYMQYRNLQTLTAVKFPILGDILANIGSIAGCIFLLKHLVLQYQVKYFFLFFSYYSNTKQPESSAQRFNEQSNIKQQIERVEVIIRKLDSLKFKLDRAKSLQITQFALLEEKWLLSIMLNAQTLSGKKHYYKIFYGFVPEIQFIQYISKWRSDLGLFMENMCETLIGLYLNDYFLTDLIVKQMMQFYYPELKDVEVKYSWRHEPLLVKFKGTEVNLQYYKNFKRRAYEMMTQKLTYKNVIYELSRMQFVLRSLQSRNLLRQSHNVGIKLNFHEFKLPSSENFLEIPQTKIINPLTLTEEDCELFSYNASMKYRDLFSEESSQYDFYEINNIRQLSESQANRSEHICAIPFI